MFKFKTLQRQDLARGALHDGLIPALDTGLGKSIYGFAWALLKTGWSVTPRTGPSLTRHLQPEKRTCIRPNAPVLLVVPGDLHQQITLEGWEKFRVDTRVLDSQDAFLRLNRQPGSLLPHLDAEGKPLVPPDFYITGYSQLTTNGVQRLPDPLDWPKPRELLAYACLPQRIPTRPCGELLKGDIDRADGDEPPEAFLSVLHVFTWRDRVWREDYDLLQIHKDDTRPELDRAFLREGAALDHWEDQKAAANARRKLEAAQSRLQNLFTYRACPQYAELTLGQQDFVIREFLRRAFAHYAEGISTTPTAPRARTGLFVPSRRTLYLAVPFRGEREAEIREYRIE